MDRPDPRHRGRAAGRGGRRHRLDGRRVLAPVPRARPRPCGVGPRPAVRRSPVSWRRRCWSVPPWPPISRGRSSTSPSSSALAAVALLWLRRVLHLGLLEEAFEIEIGDEVVCANCGQPTRRHTFCGNCGISLHALPKRPREAATMSGPADPPTGGEPRPPLRRRPPRVASGDTGTRLGGRAVRHRVRGRAGRDPGRRGRRRAARPDARAAAGLPARARIAAARRRRPRSARCRRGARPRHRPDPAGRPGAVGIRAGTPWRSSELGYEFEYSDWWAVDSSDRPRVRISSSRATGDAELDRGRRPGLRGEPRRRTPTTGSASSRSGRPDIKTDSQREERDPGPVHRLRGRHRPDLRRVQEQRVRVRPARSGSASLTASDGRTTVA